MKQSWTVFIYKKDLRTKTGERSFSTTVWQDRTQDQMDLKVAGLLRQYPKSHFRIDYFPQYKTVKNLLSGEDVVIAYNTPRCCDPSTELYHSM